MRAPTIHRFSFEGEAPSAFGDPFAESSLDGIAAGAVEALRLFLTNSGLGEALAQPGAGKMFGCLVVRDSTGALGALWAFSGQLLGQWHHQGFVGPAFDEAGWHETQSQGLRTITALSARVSRLERSLDLSGTQAELQALRLRHAGERQVLEAEHARRRLLRTQKRQATEDHDALNRESQRDKSVLKVLKHRHSELEASLVARLSKARARLAAATDWRARASAALMRRLHETYQLRNARQHVRSLRHLFAPHEPPSGAGDCCGPKLLQAAYRHGLVPVALVELWWGAPDASGRVAGSTAPACRTKCGPILPFMLEGLAVAPATPFKPQRRAVSDIAVLYEDEWLVVVDKPEGLLSVPDKSLAFDSVEAWLQGRSTGFARLAHRLDLDTSGLLVAGKSDRSYRALQAQFRRREVEKRYLAVLQGALQRPHGVIELPLRPDLDARPRQMVDATHGKPSTTRFERVEVVDGRTLVRLFPHTGRTHQLRVHAAHPEGLGMPIVGDRLYGTPARRLLLHADSLRFRHPITGLALDFDRPAPFSIDS